MSAKGEGIRGCGYRRVGGLYLVSDPGGEVCDRLPFELTVCPCCGQGIKPARGWTWVKPDKLFGGGHYELSKNVKIDSNTSIYHPELCPEDNCPVCRPAMLGERAGLLWIGERFYPSPTDFMREAREMGVSRRIKAVPKGFIVGEHWVLLAHRKAVTWESVDVSKYEKIFELVLGIFHVFKPTRLEKIVTDLTSEEDLEKLRKRGITPVVVPHDDPDHNPAAR